MNPTLAIQRPALQHTGTEPFRALGEYLSHWLVQDKALPQGDGHMVVMFPGLAADSTAFGPLRRQCLRQGYLVQDWGRGINRGPQGDIEHWLDGLSKDIALLIARDPQARPATLVGWSLGGICAREVAKRLQGSVGRVITLGTPFNARADHSRVGWLYRFLSGQPGRIDPGLSRRLAAPPPMPTTSIYSRGDGVVAWQTCTHDAQGQRIDVQDIEVAGSHLGLAWNRATLRIVAEQLAWSTSRCAPTDRRAAARLPG